MADGQVFNIPAARYQWFKDKMDQMSKKALKLTGQRSFFTVVGFHNEDNTESRWFNQKIMEVFVAIPEPKINDWTFVARIDHANEAGNIIRSTGLIDLPTHYREADPVCEHCNHNRRRRDTFVIYHKEQGFKQVGSSCLADFLGHKDVAHFAKLAELLSTVRGYAIGSFGGDLVDKRYIPTEEYLELVAQSILVYGWIPRSQAIRTGVRSTSELAADNLGVILSVSSEAKKLASDALNWALSLDENDDKLNDYLYNCWVVANAADLERRSLGIAASIVGTFYKNYFKHVEFLNEHVGSEGERVTLTIIPKFVRDTNRFIIHKASDTFGREVVWFSQKYMFTQDKIGKPMRIAARVKSHGEFKEKKSTILNFVKLLD